MPSFLSLFLCALTASAGLGAVATPAGGQCLAEICGEDVSTLTSRSSIPAVLPLRRNELTNAERLSRGLPLKAPTRRRDAVAARSQASPVPQATYNGIIRVAAASNGEILGYMSKDLIVGVGIFQTTTLIANAAQVSFGLDIGATSGTDLPITLLNTPGPLMALIQGRDNTNPDIAPGSFHYLYFGGASLPGSAPDSPPASLPNTYAGSGRLAETSVWNVDILSGVMSGQWTNTDGAQHPLQMWTQGTAMYAGADSSAFFSKYPAAVRLITLTFVPTVIAQ
ncbi:hypothetical protein B0H34DRAFT_701015 [Crassisporium funariophilum]|nr:hypothetical protein B0H34DRAFT_701015 [Crassisporium funariophilum]